MNARCEPPCVRLGTAFLFTPTTSPLLSSCTTTNWPLMFRPLFEPVFRYTPLDAEKNGFETTPSKTSLGQILTYFLAILCIAGVSFAAGR